MTIEGLLAYIAEFGYLVNNCFQHDDGTWQANLRRPDLERDGDWFTSFGRGSTAIRALNESFEQIVKSEFTPNRRVSIIEQGTVPDEAGELSEVDLLQLIGLDKPQAPPTSILRRF